QTYAVQTLMSAPPPKADTSVATRDVRFGPIADMCSARGAPPRAVRVLPHTLCLCRSCSTEKREPFAHRDQQILIGAVNDLIQRSCHSEQDLGLSGQFVAGR